MHAFSTSLFRTIRESLGRFIAIAAIVALGCGFYGGLRMTGPDMRISADRFYDGTHLYDIRLLSTLGYSDSQIGEVAAVDGVAAVMPAKSTDAMAQINEEQYALRISTLPLDSLNASLCEDGCNVESTDANYLNRLVLAEGRWPMTAGECVISADRVAGVAIEMGDKLDVLYGSQDLDGVLKTRTFTIVGTAHASSFVSSITMGATSLGSGSIQQFAYVSEEDFDADCPYTELFVEVDGAAVLQSDSDEYDEHVGVVVAALESMAPQLAQSRLDDIKRKAQETLDEKNKEYENEKADALGKLDDAQTELDETESKLADAEAQIVSGQNQVDSGYSQLNSGYAQLQSQKQEAAEKLSAAKKELEANQKKLNESSKKLEAQRESVEALPAQKLELEGQLADARAGIAQAEASLNGINSDISDYSEEIRSTETEVAPLEQTIAGIETQIASLPEDDPSLEELQKQLSELQTQKTETETKLLGLQQQVQTLQIEQAKIEGNIVELNKTISQLQDGIVQCEEGIAQFQAAEAELAAGRAELDKGWMEYYAQEESANSQIAAAEQQLASSQQQLINSQAQIDASRQEVASGREELEDGRSEYETERKKALDELADAAQVIADAQKDINELELPEIYVLDRTKNYGVASQVADSQRIDNIAAVFPFIFFLVAALVALTTMTRMVEEERTLIGTFKALGYSKARITGRYMVYAGVASTVGAIIGLALLSQILPFTISKAYAIIYNIPSYPLPLPFDWKLGLLAGGLGVGITLLATLAAAVATLWETPAALMLPRAPKAGKRILLERIGPLWQRVSFSWKVTFRNLFRYKKRLTMTIIGIAGCTALLLTGWGLHDSIWDIIDKQFGPVVNYNIIVKMDPDASESDMQNTTAYMASAGDTEDITQTYTANMQVSSASHDTLGLEVVVPKDPVSFNKLLFMKERTTQELIEFDSDSVVLTEKLARTLDVGVGDSFTLFEQDEIGNALGSGYSLTVTGIMENYIGNWAYFGANAYREATGDALVYRTLYGRCTEDMDARMVFTEGLHDLDGVQTVTYNDETIDSYRTMLTSVDMIVVVLVVSAAALAFIVLYNLTNINITERRREIASLKVLGFTKSEVHAYIFREIALLTILGALIGLVLGILIEGFVVVTAEVDYVMFGRDIHVSSFVVSFVMTLVFAAFVMLFMRKKLQDVDMVESLKSVE